MLEKLSQADLALISSEVPHLPNETLSEFLELFEKLTKEEKEKKTSSWMDF